MNPLTPLLVAGAGISAMLGSTADASIIAGTWLVSAAIGGLRPSAAWRQRRCRRSGHWPAARGRSGRAEFRSWIRSGGRLLGGPGDRCRFRSVRSAPLHALRPVGCPLLHPAVRRPPGVPSRRRRTAPPPHRLPLAHPHLLGASALDADSPPFSLPATACSTASARSPTSRANSSWRH